MEWFTELLYGSGVAHSIFILALTIAIGVLLGKVRLFGVSLGATFILFVGIFFGEMGVRVNADILHFFKEFGLILFVFAIGLQVGPSFFTNFKKGGLQLNLLATLIVALGVVITVVIYFLSDVPLQTMVGIMSGAITNTPGLGAAQQAYTDLMGSNDPSIAMGYAVAYPLGVVGIILSMILLKKIGRVDAEKEEQELISASEQSEESVAIFSLEVQNPSIAGRTVYDLSHTLEGHQFVISRIWKKESGLVFVAGSDSVLELGDRILVVAPIREEPPMMAMVGPEVEMEEEEWRPLNLKLESKRVVVTKSDVAGKQLKDLGLRKLYGVNVTRVTRAGIDLMATPGLTLQFGDTMTVVGPSNALTLVAKMVGNSQKHLHEPNLITIFIGIAFGVLLGSIPFVLPGIPHPVKLGLAGGPLIVAILIGRYGHRYKLVPYTTQSANLMLREIGISSFLACVGLGAGDGFVDTIMNGGLVWVAYGFIITVVPIIIVGLIGRFVYKLDYFALCGLIAGSTTDPPALAYANSQSQLDVSAVSYATVYPLTMFLRVLAAQLLILFLL